MISADQRLPVSNDVSQLKLRLIEAFRQIATEHNKSYYWNTSGMSAPSSGTWASGDKCKNTSPSELGSAGSKYVITGWVCTVTGTPGTWLQMRTLTGN